MKSHIMVWVFMKLGYSRLKSSYHHKSKNKGTQRSPFGIGSYGSRLGEVAEHKTSLELQMFKLK
jgi:hypothetical protein